jgi:hypothetical protein
MILWRRNAARCSIRRHGRIVHSLDITLQRSLEVSAAFQAIVQNTRRSEGGVGGAAGEAAPSFAGR